MNIPPDRLIAHRGCPELFPENTLVGLQAAVAAGAKWLEFDVQITADHVPILYHDADATRVSGCTRLIAETELADLRRYGAWHFERFGNHFRGLPVSTLAQVIRWLARWNGVAAFVEIKPDSAPAIGVDKLVDIVFDVLAHAPMRSIAGVISKDERIVQRVLDTRWPAGWVLPHWHETSHAAAQRLEPDYLFCNVTRLPPDPADRWHGRWEWCVYTVDDAPAICSLLDQQVALVETNRFCELAREKKKDAQN